ncbi:hypothetical protein FB476_1050 [Ornithinimicrobium humiphilum]|uniref:Uncharacterized protein n=1 Tax=Ornithinimicrobium humiphilum TaxID=125288 RepID=A0A543KM89_9MICO|nr:hypothetical protein [Ornithinimicrobium humiphilum]TQM96186.1 hypothetical protein FB476_1050 [Ornithinimicrobium humiphilum]
MTEMIREIRSTRRPAPLTWVPVQGADGRVRMEMRWQVGSPARTTPQSVAPGKIA